MNLLLRKKAPKEDLRRQFNESDYKSEEEEEVEEEELDLPREVEEDKKKKKVEKRWQVQSVPTETQTVIFDSKTKKVYDLFSAVVELLNRTEE